MGRVRDTILWVENSRCGQRSNNLALENLRIISWYTAGVNRDECKRTLFIMDYHVNEVVMMYYGCERSYFALTRSKIGRSRQAILFSFYSCPGVNIRGRTSM